MSQEPLVVIALTGQARAGKDSVASFLAAHAGFQPIALADGIREALNSLDGRTWQYRKERDAHELSDRWAMQIAGTECREDIGAPYLWLELAAAKIRYAHHYHPVPRHRFVIPDLRYPREDQYLEGVVPMMGGRYEVWRVSRIDRDEIAESSHSSEQHCMSIPCTRWIWNDGTLRNLGEKALEAWGKTERAWMDADGVERILRLVTPPETPSHA